MDSGVRWANVTGRFSSWFAETLVAGDHDLAGRIAHVAARIRAIHAPVPLALTLVLDYLDTAELARLEISEPEEVPFDLLGGLVADFESLLDLTVGPAHGDGSCAERAQAYLRPWATGSGSQRFGRGARAAGFDARRGFSARVVPPGATLTACLAPGVSGDGAASPR